MTHRARLDLATLAILVAAVVAIWGPLKYEIIASGRMISDYDPHVRLAEEIARTGRIPAPHFLTQALIIGGTWLIPGLSFPLSAWLVDMLAYVAAAVVIYALLRRSVTGRCVPARLVCGFLTVALLFAWPIVPFFWRDRNSLYLGYIGTSNVYHGPSQIVLKPLALLLFWYAGRVFSPPGRYPMTTSAATLAVLTVLATIAKPSYTICLLPALVLAGLLHRRTGEPVNWRLAVAGIFVPAVLVLVWQYLITYTVVLGVSTGAGVVLAPLAVLGRLSSHLGPKLILSTLFPACVVALYFQAALADVRLRFAWIGFLIGLGYAYLLAESGVRLYAQNFVWSAQITSFILFVTSVAFLIRQHPAVFAAPWQIRRWSGRDWRLLVVMAAFAAHLVSGLVWYYLHFPK